MRKLIRSFSKQDYEKFPAFEDFNEREKAEVYRAVGDDNELRPVIIEAVLGYCNVVEEPAIGLKVHLEDEDDIEHDDDFEDYIYDDNGNLYALDSYEGADKYEIVESFNLIVDYIDRNLKHLDIHRACEVIGLKEVANFENPF